MFSRKGSDVRWDHLFALIPASETAPEAVMLENNGTRVPSGTVIAAAMYGE
jgi:hypothetical protein